MATDKKRKIPARASARVEQVSKRRQSSTPLERSETPSAFTSAQAQPEEHTSTPPPPPAPSLPKSIQPGKPLPTVEDAQPEDLSMKDYQSIGESNVLIESLSRSRQKWTNEGLFDKFWTKPTKKKGAASEEVKNPPKDSMSKVGTVTITIEPHIIEATMYVVKDAKAKTPTQPPAQAMPQHRPILQYGPPNGVMPPQIPKAAPSPGPSASTSPALSSGPGPIAGTAPALAPAPAPPQALQKPSVAAPEKVPTVSAQHPLQPQSKHQPPLQSQQSPSQSPPQIPASMSGQTPGMAPNLASPAPDSKPVVTSVAQSQQGGPGSGPKVTNKPMGTKPVATNIIPAPAPMATPGYTPRPNLLPAPSPQPRSAPGAQQSQAQPQAQPQSQSHGAISPANPVQRPNIMPSPNPSQACPVVAGSKNPNSAAPRPLQGPPGSASATATPILARPVAPVPTPVQAPAPVGGASKPSPNDPVIALLAQKASGDPELRDLMKRVAVGQAREGELAHFQKIIDQLNAECKQRAAAAQQGPSADKLFVDGRTVKYFADEVRTILDIVLASNPNQKSADLRPPPRSDPFVVIIVKTALEDNRTKDMIRRIAEGRPSVNDAKELKEILDRIHRDMKTTSQKPATVATAQPTSAPAPAAPIVSKSTSTQSNGQVKAPAPAPASQSTPNPQALRSKGPPPAPKPDITAVVFDFGTGDRYLFPKFTILEYLPMQSGQQVLASFLIVRKGSISEYGGDPTLDYYQPVTMRLFSPSGRHLENLARVVAPQDEVRRYMDDVMDNMTRAEYVLLAMRLPRTSPDGEKEANGSLGGDKTNRSTPQLLVESEADPSSSVGDVDVVKKQPVLWASTTTTIKPSYSNLNSRDADEEAAAQYRRLITSVASKDVRPAQARLV